MIALFRVKKKYTTYASMGRVGCILTKVQRACDYVNNTSSLKFESLNQRFHPDRTVSHQYSSISQRCLMRNVFSDCVRTQLPFPVDPAPCFPENPVIVFYETNDILCEFYGPFSAVGPNRKQYSL
jgi:hypothetical protein